MHTLIGLLDSPFVRRVAVTMRHHDIPFERTAWSVYRNVEQMKQVNPLVTVPTLVLPDGSHLISSDAIIDYLDESVGSDRALMPRSGAARRDVLQVVAHGHVVCDKVGQLYRELPWRPAALHHPPAIDRFRSQIAAGLAELERRLTGEWYVADRMTQADIKAAIVLTFVRYYASTLGIVLASHPRLEALTARLESTPAFIATPLD